MSDDVLLRHDGPVTQVVLNRPEKRNALDRPFLEALLGAVTHAVERPEAHVVVIHGAGPGFCAGADLDYISSLTASQDPAEAFMPSVDIFQQIVFLLATAPRVTIAAVHGFALGAGFDLAIACDLRVAAVGTEFASSYVRYGLVPDGGGTWSLPRLIGLGPALAILLSGDTIDTEGAYRVGLIQRRTPPGKHVDEALAWADELARRSRVVQAAVKRLARVDPRMSLSAALKEEREMQRRIVGEREPFRFLKGPATGPR
jgi:2-(1,2-epoxy-1,2-dihydrophenyl)acetyl-CoA isomerase